MIGGLLAAVRLGYGRRQILLICLSRTNFEHFGRARSFWIICSTHFPKPGRSREMAGVEVVEIGPIYISRVLDFVPIRVGILDLVFQCQRCPWLSPRRCNARFGLVVAMYVRPNNNMF